MRSTSLRHHLTRGQQRVLDVVAKALPKSAKLYLVGGTVRDMLRRCSVHDVDLVITGLPLVKVASRLRKLGRVTERGSAFGVLIFTPAKTSWNIDVALPRTERADGTGGYRDFSFVPDPSLPMEEDLARRDFTINAMAYAWATGELLDPFGGRHDLRARRLRAVGNPRTRFQEDYSRILRLVRFAAELDFSADEPTARAARALAPGLKEQRKGRFIVPREVVADQLVRSLLANPVRSAVLLRSYRISALLPPYTPPQWRRAVAAMKRLPGTTSATMVLAALLHPLGPNAARRACTELQLPSAGHGIACGDLVRTVAWTGVDPRVIQDIPAGELAERCTGVAGRELLQLLSATSPKTARALHARLKRMLFRRSGIYVTPPPLLTGAEVVRVARVMPGPIIGRLLADVREQQLMGTIKTKAAAQRYLTKKVRGR